MFMSDMLLDEAGSVSANAGRVKINKENRAKTISDNNFFLMKRTPRKFILGWDICKDCANFEARSTKFYYQ
ncbi:hypothetical protein UF75_3164 [Desulfosporosinus sp. I2]|nr:hypothetical protein UF75_3164 [Desulfosporosinus sp. I2]